MKDATPQPIRLAEYTVPPWLVDEVSLTFRLAASATVVTSRIKFRPNPDTDDRTFRLDGEKLQLIRAMIDGHPIDPRIDDTGLTAQVPNAPFTWECEVEIDPSSNTELEGLYLSNGLFCTQCEAEGFRKITYYPDRPDVMAPFTVRIESDLPVLLSNGNQTRAGDGWAEWRDPWPKPSYLFALVAGDLVAHSGHFTTMEDRKVDLNIWVRPGDEDRCAFALDSLIRSMKWDEQVYGRAYDLDVFNLVAVDDFNAGAMENKGLNIFNSKYVLSSAETATDRDYEFIEGIVAHEYFHNWTGNRITCRDWFQLCLKEGLTVFRDQQFSADMRDPAVKRIDDVLMLRARQFREDAGPLAHPVRPEDYIEINNFYTATVYEKGAEVIAMLKMLVGDENYYDALDEYFSRFDGQACTIEDWLDAFRGVSTRDLTQFKLWYSQAGTPRLRIETEKTPTGWAIHAKQSTPPTPGQPTKKPLVIPIRIALFDRSGAQLGEEERHILDTAEATLITTTGPDKPIVSALRGFSAPVILDQDLTSEDRLTLLAHDTDPFNRWEAGRQLAKQELTTLITKDRAPSDGFLAALNQLAADDALDPAFRAFALGLPSVDDMSQSLFEAGLTPDPVSIQLARARMETAIGQHLEPTLLRLVDQMHSDQPFSPDAKAAGQRALRLKALKFLAAASKAHVEPVAGLFANANNMTESLGALAILISETNATDQIATFYDRWKGDPNIIDKWFAVQITAAPPDQALQTAKHLTTHPDFHWKTPNRFRSVIGAIAGNPGAFHAASGEGYRLVADWLKRLDPINPQTAARLITVFEVWRQFNGDRQSMMQDAVQSLLNNGASRDVTEMATRILGE